MLFYVYMAIGLLCGIAALVFCPMALTAAFWYIAPLSALVGWLVPVVIHVAIVLITALTLD